MVMCAQRETVVNTTASITRELHHEVMSLARRLQAGVEDGNMWQAIETVESRLLAIINAEATRLAGIEQHQNL
jgi:hypothetical protein